MQSTKCYHGLTILFNPKALRPRVDLGMLKVSLVFAKSICPLFTEEISERVTLDPYDYLLRTIFPDEKEILKQRRKRTSSLVMREALILTEIN